MLLLDLSEAKAEIVQRRQTEATIAAAVEAAERKSRRRSLSSDNTPAIVGFGGHGGFAAAKLNRLTADFLGQSRSADQDLYGDNKRLRGRARQLAHDNPFAKKFLGMVAQNVVGHKGVLLQAKVRNENGKETAETKRINRRIEQEWKRWCRVGRCTADGKYSFAELQLLAIKNIAREGENFVKKVYGRQFNDVGFALQPLDNDQIDDAMMTSLEAGSEIRMGVEVDQYRRPLGYWLFQGHPNDPISRRMERKRVAAEDMIHSAIWERPAQTRGYSWMAASILSMNQYGRYAEAVEVASRASAAKFLVIEEEYPEGYTGDDDDELGTETNEDGTRVMSGDAGEALVLDPGQKANFIDPRFPANNHRDFTRVTIRNIATGLMVSYPSLGNDLEAVNFSSIRAGLLEERDHWRIIQHWFIDHFLQPIFDSWLRMALLTVLSDITISREQRDMFEWKPRGWDWVDPLKDAQAIVLKLQNGLITYADALASLGLDFEETMTERAQEQAFLDALGVTLGTDITGKADSADDDEVDSGDKGKRSEIRYRPLVFSGKRAEKRIERAKELFRALKAAA